MVTMHMSPDEIKEIIDCIDYAIDQMETSRIAVLTTQTADDSEEEFAKVIYGIEYWKRELVKLAEAQEGVIVVD